MTNDDQRLEQTLHALETQALNFGYRRTTDAATRQWYIQKTQALSRELRAQHRSGAITARKAAEIAHEMRNSIMDMARARSSDIGLAAARQLKSGGIEFKALVDKYAHREWGRPFDTLSDREQNKVLLEVVDAAGRPNPKVNAQVSKMAQVGRALWALSAAIAIYNISSAEDKTHQAGRELANVGGGFAGGAAAGAAAGIWFGPLGVGIGVAVGGIVGAIIANEAYSELTTPKDARVAKILPRFTGMFSFDEDGLAQAMYDELGMDMDSVHAVFREIRQDHAGDADSAAYAYARLVQEKGGSPLAALKLNSGLRQELASALQGGWWVTNAEKAEAQRLIAMR